MGHSHIEKVWEPKNGSMWCQNATITVMQPHSQKRTNSSLSQLSQTLHCLYCPGTHAGHGVGVCYAKTS